MAGSRRTSYATTAAAFTSAGVDAVMLVFLSLAAGIVLGALLWHHFRPRVLAYLDEPRESRRDRRRRLASCYAGNALESCTSGLGRDALYWARRAHRLYSEHPFSLYSMAKALIELDRYGEACVYFERSYRRATEDLMVDEEEVRAGEAAHGVAACHGYLARQAETRDEREQHQAAALSWLRVAIDHEPGIADRLMRSAFVGLDVQVEGVVSQALGQGGLLDP